MFRFILSHDSAGWLALSDEPAYVLGKMWPTNYRQREIARLELKRTGRTVNGPLTITDKEYKPDET